MRLRRAEELGLATNFMKKCYLYILPLLCFGQIAQCEINWTPHLNTNFAEGTSIASVYFSDGAKKFALVLDGETTVEAANGGAKFAFKRPASSVFKLGVPITKVTLPVAADKVAEYRKCALAYAPSDVTEFSDFEAVADVYPINHWQSYRVLFSYALFGQRVRHCITFLTLENGQQVALDLSAHEKDFAEALNRAEHMIWTWDHLESVGPRSSSAN